MSPTNPTTVINEHLLNEIARTTLSMDTVYLCYAAAVVVAAVLWTFGVIAFGRRCSTEPFNPAVANSSRERLTPAAL